MALILGFALQVGLAAGGWLSDDTDNRFGWRMFSGSERQAPAVIEAFGPGLEPFRLDLVDPVHTGRHYLASVRAQLCPSLAERGYRQVVFGLRQPEGAPAYLRQLALEPAFCPPRPP